MTGRALVALRRLRQTRRFTECNATRSAMLEFRGTTDPFCNCELDFETEIVPNGTAVVADARNAFNAHAQRNAISPMGETEFGKALKRHRPNVQKVKRGAKSTAAVVLCRDEAQALKAGCGAAS